MITQENYQDFTNYARPPYVRAASLVQTIQNRIKLDSGYYRDFIQVLEKKREYYKSILQLLSSRDVGVHRQPTYSQYHPDEDFICCCAIPVLHVVCGIVLLLFHLLFPSKTSLCVLQMINLLVLLHIYIFLFCCFILRRFCTSLVLVLCMCVYVTLVLYDYSLHSQ